MNTLQSQKTLSLGKPSQTQRFGRWAEEASFVLDKWDVCTYVVTGEVVDVSLRKHRVVLELTLAERRGVASNDDELGLSGSEGLEGRFVSKSDWVER
jgi:hypothetical protein